MSYLMNVIMNLINVISDNLIDIENILILIIAI